MGEFDRPPGRIAPELCVGTRPILKHRLLWQPRAGTGVFTSDSVGSRLHERRQLAYGTG